MAKLTGDFRFRTDWRGKLILQIEYWYFDLVYDSSKRYYKFRDAKLSDFKCKELKDKINLEVNIK